MFLMLSGHILGLGPSIVNLILKPEQYISIQLNGTGVSKKRLRTLFKKKIQNNTKFENAVRLQIFIPSI